MVSDQRIADGLFREIRPYQILNGRRKFKIIILIVGILGDQNGVW
jgi:hypothetical protein